MRLIFKHLTMHIPVGCYFHFLILNLGSSNTTNKLNAFHAVRMLLTI